MVTLLDAAKSRGWGLVGGSGHWKHVGGIYPALALSCIPVSYFWSNHEVNSFLHSTHPLPCSAKAQGAKQPQSELLKPQTQNKSCFTWSHSLGHFDYSY